MAHITKPKRVQYIGDRAEVWEVRRTPRPTSERVVLHRWEETGKVTVRHCEGDGRTEEYILHEEWTLPWTVTDREATALAVGMLRGVTV